MSKHSFYCICFLTFVGYACTKEEIGNLNFDFTDDYNITLPYFPADTPLTSNKTFIMKVLEYGSDVPLQGAVLKFGAPDCITCDSLKSDANGVIQITGRDVNPTWCLLVKNGYWIHGAYAGHSLPMAKRIDTVIRGATVDSVVTRMFPFSWVNIQVSPLAPYPGSFLSMTASVYHYNSGKYLGQLWAGSWPRNKDTTFTTLVFGNTNVKIAMSIPLSGAWDTKTVFSEIKKIAKSDTATITMKY